MPRLVHVTTGAVVHVSDETAALLDAEWIASEVEPEGEGDELTADDETSTSDGEPTGEPDGETKSEDDESEDPGDGEPTGEPDASDEAPAGKPGRAKK